MTEKKEKIYAHLDEGGQIVLPPELLSRHRMKPGTRFLVNENANSFKLVSPTRLAKLYIEPTNRCNLECRTCIRNTWEGAQGMMSDEAFDRIIKGLCAFSPQPSVFFGGLGEPLYHPKIVDMVAQAKQLGSYVELITNGTLLTADLSKRLLTAGIDMVWVSIDGATPESYADNRIGAKLSEVIENVTQFSKIIRTEGHGTGCCGFVFKYNAQLGIVFVAMKRNVRDLPAVLRLGRKLGAKRFMVTNVLPYTAEMQEEILYGKVLGIDKYQSISLPKIEDSDVSREPLRGVMDDMNLTLAMGNPQMSGNRCPFIENGAGAVGWHGGLSPCLPLLHSHASISVQGNRFSRCWTIGNVMDHSLPELWYAPEHVAFRERVQVFDFPPCVSCGGCDLAEKNEEDCYGNAFPTCGACLWAQGVIQCP